MTSIVKFLAFSGADEAGPHCYLLQVDEFRFLLDCGWDEDLKQSTVDQLKKHVHQIDAVLLSYPDNLHLGALPYLVGRLGLSCPIYATVPVYKMGQMFMYDIYQSRQNSEEFSIYSLDDVDTSFEKITQLKYSQSVSLSGKGQGLTITPLPAGHMIGGTIWKIVKDGEEEIIYAVDYNNKKDRHLNACRFESISVRPHVLITDVYNVDCPQIRRVLRDEQLMNTILETVRNDGNVLISIDTAGRVLELSQLLDQMWRNQETGLMAYSLVLMNNVAYNVVEFAKSQVEWMSDRIVKAFEDQRNNPFQFKYIQLCHSMADLQKIPDPKVVLASSPDMQYGFSRDLFTLWCSNAKNCVVLTCRSSHGTLCRQLMNHPDMSTVTIEVKRRVKLEGKELEEHLRIEKEKEAELQRSKNRLSRKDQDELSSESEDEGEPEETSPVIRTKHDLMLRNEGKTKTGFFKQAKKSYPMFPVREERIRADEYGELIRPEDFAFNEPIATEEQMVTDEGAGECKEKEVPTKCVKSFQNFSVRARILYIDFEGRSDGESVKKIIAQFKPRQLILVRGSATTKQRLAEYCRTGSIQSRVLIPRLNEMIDATTDSHIYQVRLKDSIVSALRFYKARETEIAWVDAMLEIKKSLINAEFKTDLEKIDDKMEDDEGDKNKDEDSEMKVDDDFDLDFVPTLIPLPSNEIPSHPSVFINEPRLSEFRQFVSSRGIQTEMMGGALICNNVVAVRRNEAGKLQLEGCVCEDYYKIREYLYEQFAIV